MISKTWKIFLNKKNFGLGVKLQFWGHFRLMLKREAKYANYVSKNLVSRSFEVTRGQKLRQNFLEKNYVAFQNYLSRDKLEGRLSKTSLTFCFARSCMLNKSRLHRVTTGYSPRVTSNDLQTSVPESCAQELHFAMTKFF